MILLVLLAGLILTLVLLPFDAAIVRSMDHAKIPGDIKRTLKTLQEYGGVGSMLLAMVVIWLVDPARRRVLADWVMAALLAGALCTAIRMVVGRIRPGVADAEGFLGILGTYDMPVRKGEYVALHAWSLGGKDLWKLWSMPSSHTVLAAVMSVFLAYTYPRLRPLALGMLIIVGVSRVVFRAHYPSDVVVGAAVGIVMASCAVQRHWGVAVLDAIDRLRGRTPAVAALPGGAVQQAG
jgi:membrane-associated phospholipid phosphatase